MTKHKYLDFRWLKIQWIFQVPVKGGRDYITPLEGKDYKWYISGIFPANWGMDYATDPTF